MTGRAELRELIANGENSGVEFKRDDLRPQDLAREVVALSNSEGGLVLLGVEDDGGVSGLRRPDAEEWVMNVCRDKVRPEVVPFFETVKDAEPGRDVAILRISRGYAVHALWHNETRRYLLRVGSQSREAGSEELARLFQRRGAMRADLGPVSGTTIRHLDLRRLGDYFGVVRQQEAPPESDLDAWKTLLVNTELMADDCATLGGLLLFGKEPSRFLPQSGVDAAAYLGAEKDYATKERSAMRGPLAPSINGEGEVVADGGLVDQAFYFVRRNTRHDAKIVHGRRVDRPEYPPDVVRETIVNALVHRDYLLTGTTVELSIYSDRLEVVSPGRLPNGVTPAALRAGVRAARNPLLNHVMRDFGYVESMGMGVPRKIIKGMREHNGTEPEFIEQHERFTVRLFA